MKNIIKFAVGNPVTICMVVFALLLLGKVSYDQLSVDLLPDLNNPRLFIELKAGGLCWGQFATEDLYLGTMTRTLR